MKASLRVLVTLVAFNGVFAPVTPAYSGDADSSYFPLSLGNEWSFSSRFFPHTERIADTATINGKLYYGLTIWSPSVAYWLRFSDDSVFVMQTRNDTTEYLLYDFTADVGDTISLPSIFTCEWGNRLILESKEESVSTSAGTFAHCFHFKHVSQCMDAGMLDSWFARGVGRVKYTENNIAGLMIYELASYSLPTGVEATISEAVPGSYTPLECYPNPFNAETTLRFHLARTSSVSLRIVDLLGRQIALLFSEQKKPGSYDVVWNAGALPSGAYFAVFRANDYVQIRKLLLQK